MRFLWDWLQSDAFFTAAILMSVIISAALGAELWRQREE
jgi:hypothetical protein